MKTLQQIIKFGSVGVLNTGIDLGILNLLVWFGLGPIWANSISFTAAATNSFFWNKFWTFKDHKQDWKKQLLPFILVAVVGLGLSDIILYIFHVRMGFNLNLVKVASVVVVFWWNFFIPKLFIFKS
jgi:putative flippase GtrA